MHYSVPAYDERVWGAVLSSRMSRKREYMEDLCWPDSWAFLGSIPAVVFSFACTSKCSEECAKADLLVEYIISPLLHFISCA